MIRFLAVALALAVLPAGASAGSLAEIYRLALENDADYAAARAAYRAGREAWPQARAAVLPTVAASATYAEVERETEQTPFAADGAGPGGFDFTPPFSDRFGSDTYSIELRQPLFAWDIPATLRQGRKRVEIAYLAWRAEQKLLIARVMEAYLGYLGAEAVLELARAERRSIQSDLERTRGRYEVGEVSVTALREAQAAVDLAESRIITARSQLDSARETLRRITGVWFENLPDVEGDLELQPPDPADPREWVDTAFDYNATYLSAVREAGIAEDEISLTKSDLIPELDLVASYQEMDDSEYVLGGASNDTRVGVQATWTLFAGGRNLSEVREARALYDRARANLESTQREVATTVRNAYRRVLSELSRVRALEKAVESARAALESVRAEFELGERTQADVLNARRNLYSALTDLAQSEYDYLIAGVELKLVAGVLSEEDLARLDARLESAPAAEDDNDSQNDNESE